MDTLKNWINQAAVWVAAHPQDVVYAAVIVAGYTVISTATGERRR